jgi:hypothetical protein
MLTPYERLALFRFDFFVRLNSLMAQDDQSDSLENQILTLDKAVFSTRLHPLGVKQEENPGFYFLYMLCFDSDLVQHPNFDAVMWSILTAFSIKWHGLYHEHSTFSAYDLKKLLIDEENSELACPFLKLLMDGHYASAFKMISLFNILTTASLSEKESIRRAILLEGDGREPLLYAILDECLPEKQMDLLGIIHKCLELDILKPEDIKRCIHRYSNHLDSYAHLFLDKSISQIKLRAFVNEFKFWIAQNLLTSDELEELHKVYSIDGMTLRLLDGIILNNPDGIGPYLDLLKTMYEAQFLSKVYFSILVLTHPREHYSPMLELLYRKKITENIEKSTESLTIYLNFVKEMADRNYLDKQDVKNAILYINKRGYCAFYQAFNGFSFEVTKFFWMFCQSFFDQKEQLGLLMRRYGEKKKLLSCDRAKPHAFFVNAFVEEITMNALEQVRVSVFEP